MDGCRAPATQMVKENAASRGSIFYFMLNGINYICKISHYESIRPAGDYPALFRSAVACGLAHRAEQQQ